MDRLDELGENIITLSAAARTKLLSMVECTCGFVAACVLHTLMGTSCLNLVGFARKGHIDSPGDIIWHGVQSEHALLHQLALEGSVAVLGESRADLRALVKRSSQFAPRAKAKAKAKAKARPKAKLVARPKAKVRAKPWQKCGRGSHTTCEAPRCSCQAKVAKPALASHIVAKYGQRTALCKFHQAQMAKKIVG